MRHFFSEQLDAVYDDLATLASDVAAATRRASTALFEGDPEVAESVISADLDIDAQRDKLEERSFQIISLQQPVAGDLRTLIATLRIVSELERCGDLAVHVAKVARMRVPGSAVPEAVRGDVQRMAALAVDMTNRTAAILADRDTGGVEDLADLEAEMDTLRAGLLDTVGAPGWTDVRAAVDLALLGRYYERIGDHAVSIARRVVFAVTGETPRH